jgi:hypothetical protein
VTRSRGVRSTDGRFEPKRLTTKAPTTHSSHTAARSPRFSTKKGRGTTVSDRAWLQLQDGRRRGGYTTVSVGGTGSHLRRVLPGWFAGRDELALAFSAVSRLLPSSPARHVFARADTMRNSSAKHGARRERGPPRREYGITAGVVSELFLSSRSSVWFQWTWRGPRGGRTPGVR